jgi:hypothetical protein
VAKHLLSEMEELTLSLNQTENESDLRSSQRLSFLNSSRESTTDLHRNNEFLDADEDEDEDEVEVEDDAGLILSLRMKSAELRGRISLSFRNKQLIILSDQYQRLIIVKDKQERRYVSELNELRCERDRALQEKYRVQLEYVQLQVLLFYFYLFLFIFIFIFFYFYFIHIYFLSFFFSFFLFFFFSFFLSFLLHIKLKFTLKGKNRTSNI